MLTITSIKKIQKLDLFLLCWNQIKVFNQATFRTTWKVFPKICFVHLPDPQKPIFVKAIMDIATKKGSKDRTQSAEEAGAVGRAFLISPRDLLQGIQKLHPEFNATY